MKLTQKEVSLFVKFFPPTELAINQIPAAPNLHSFSTNNTSKMIKVSSPTQYLLFLPIRTLSALTPMLTVHLLQSGMLA